MRKISTSCSPSEPKAKSPEVRLAAVEASFADIQRRLDLLQYHLAVVAPGDFAGAAASSTRQRQPFSEPSHSGPVASPVVDQPVVAPEPRRESTAPCLASFAEPEHRPYKYIRTIKRWGKRLFLASFVWSCLFGNPLKLPQAAWAFTTLPWAFAMDTAQRIHCGHLDYVVSPITCR